MFDFNHYIANLIRSNRLAVSHGFTPGTCTGIEGIESIIQAWRTTRAFCLTDDIETGQTLRRGGAFFQRRTLTIFLLMRCHPTNEAERLQAIATCRDLRRQLQSRIVADAHLLQDSLTYIDLDQMPTTDLGTFVGSGLTGCYFMINIDEPINLTLNPDEW